MSGNQPIEDPPEGVGFPTIGQYDVIPGPGEAGYVEPDAADHRGAELPDDEGSAEMGGDEIEALADDSGDDSATDAEVLEALGDPDADEEC